MTDGLDMTALSAADDERELKLARAEAAVVRSVWMAGGALLAVPVPFFAALGLGGIVTRELPTAPKDPQEGEWYGLDGQGRVVLGRRFDSSGALNVEDVLEYEADHLTRVTYESSVMGTEISARMLAQRVGVARPASLSPATYEEFTPDGRRRWSMGYDSEGRCEEIECRSESVDGMAYYEAYRLHHDEQGLVRIVDQENGEVVFARSDRPAATDLREAAAAVVPLLVATVLGHPAGQPDEILTLMFAGPAVPYVAWVPPGGHEDPMCFPEVIDPEDDADLPAATVELLKRTQRHIESDAALQRKYATSLRRQLEKASGLRGVRLTWDDLSPL